MMETVEVTDHRSGQDLLSNVQIVSSEGGRVEVLSKMAPVTVTSIMPNQDIMTAQYINLHRMPEHLNKVIVTDPISGELHHVDLSGSADFGHHTVTAQYYDTEELLAHGLTEDERRLAAELVAAQLKSQQQGTTILTTQDLLNAKTLTAQDLLNAKTLTTQDLLNAKALTTQDLLNAKALTTQDLLNGKALTTQDLLNGKTLTTQDLLNAKTLTTQDLLNAKTLTTQDLLNAKTLTTQDLLNAKTLTTQDLLNAKTLTTQDLLNAKTLTTQDLLNAKALTSLGTVSLDKSNLSAAIVTGYLQTVDEVQQQMLQQDNQERCIMKIYPTQGQHELQVLNRTSSQPLPPLKKVLSSQSMMVRNKFSESPGIMVELQNSDLLDTSQVPNNCIKPEHLDNNTPVVMTTAASSTPPTTSLPSHHPPSTNPSLNQSGPTAADDLDSEDYDAENDTARAASRKSLPHKKRFPRKLKGQGGGAPSGGAVRNPAQKTYKCAKCGESCGTQAQLAAHKLTHLAPVKRGAAGAGSGTGSAAIFNCELCQKQFGTQLKFFEHLKQHYEPGGGVMGVVGMEGLRVEGEGVMGGMVGSVQQEMGKEMVEQHNSMKVEAAVTSTGLTCAHCGKVFRRQKALETHVSVAHPSQDEIEEFSEPEDMMEGIRHVVNMPAVDSGDEEGGEEKMRWRYQLNASASNYTSMGGDMGAAPMQTLQDMHTLEAAAAAAQPPPAALPPPQAPDGGQGEEAAGGGTVPKGSVKVDSVDGEKRTALMCLECNRVFNHRNSLLYHLRSHSGLRPHQCDVCGKGFISGSALKVHMRLHSGDKPYKCEHCSRHFRQWGDLKYHVTSLHSDQKQFQCEYCGKDFARKYSLNVHRRIHTGEKNYKCEFCGKTFRASSYLKNHTRIHTGEKPHCCDLCGKPFRVRSDMKRHRRTHTKDSTTAAAYLTARDEDDEVELIEDEAARMHQESRLHHQSHLVEGEDESSETILPDQAPIPLNLNIKGADVGEGEEELVYTTTGARGAHHSVDSRDGTLYVWIPAAPDSILSDE